MNRNHRAISKLKPIDGVKLYEAGVLSGSSVTLLLIFFVSAGGFRFFFLSPPVCVLGFLILGVPGLAELGAEIFYRIILVEQNMLLHLTP